MTAGSLLSVAYIGTTVSADLVLVVLFSNSMPGIVGDATMAVPLRLT